MANMWASLAGRGEAPTPPAPQKRVVKWYHENITGECIFAARNDEDSILEYA